MRQEARIKTTITQRRNTLERFRFMSFPILDLPQTIRDCHSERSEESCSACGPWAREPARDSSLRSDRQSPLVFSKPSDCGLDTGANGYYTTRPAGVRLILRVVTHFAWHGHLGRDAARAEPVLSAAKECPCHRELSHYHLALFLHHLAGRSTTKSGWSWRKVSAM